MSKQPASGTTGRRSAGPGTNHVRLLLAAVFCLGACALGIAVTKGLTLDFDTFVLSALRDPSAPSKLIGPGWLAETIRDVSALGSNVVLAPVCLVVAIHLSATRCRQEAVALLAIYAGALLLSHGIKILVGRPRPEIVPTLAKTFTLSFPSSHAVASSAVYGTLCGFWLRSWRRDDALEHSLAVVTTAVLILAIGASRVWLGVHYPTDVLAGWMIGGAWALLVNAAFDPSSRKGSR